LRWVKHRANRQVARIYVLAGLCVWHARRKWKNLRSGDSRFSV